MHCTGLWLHGSPAIHGQLLSIVHVTHQLQCGCTACSQLLQLLQVVGIPFPGIVLAHPIFNSVCVCVCACVCVCGLCLCLCLFLCHTVDLLGAVTSDENLRHCQQFFPTWCCCSLIQRTEQSVVVVVLTCKHSQPCYHCCSHSKASSTSHLLHGTPHAQK